jgi:hypothetical protein
LAERAQRKVRERFDVHVLTAELQQLLLTAAGRVPADRSEPAAARRDP